MFHGPLEDRIAIRERLDAYADSVCRIDVDAWLANYSDDGVWSVLGSEYRGKAALRAVWTPMWSAIERFGFFNQVSAVEIDGERALARSFCREIMLLKSGVVRKVVGRYDDQLVRQSGVWLFARRDYQLVIDEPTNTQRVAAPLADQV